MVENTVVIHNDDGLHARPATKIIEIVNNHKSNAFLCYNNKKINLRSIVSIMSLSIEKGTEIKFITEGDDEQELLDKLVELVNSKFE